jgi:hypothetical protein
MPQTENRFEYTVHILVSTLVLKFLSALKEYSDKHEFYFFQILVNFCISVKKRQANEKM